MARRIPWPWEAEDPIPAYPSKLLTPVKVPDTFTFAGFKTVRGSVDSMMARAVGGGLPEPRAREIVTESLRKAARVKSEKG